MAWMRQRLLFWFVWVLFVSHCFLTNSFGLCNIVEQNNSQTISNSKMTIFKGSIWHYCIKSFHSNYMHYADLPAMFTMMRFYPELTMFYQIPCSLTLHRRSFNSLTSRVRNAFNVWRSSFLPFIYRLFISCKKWSHKYRYIYIYSLELCAYSSVIFVFTHNQFVTWVNTL